MFNQFLLQSPNAVLLETDNFRQPMNPNSSDRWGLNDVQVGLSTEPDGLRFWLEAPQSAVKRVFLRWSSPVQAGSRFLGDAWERGYGDLEWRGIVPERVMPWYVIANWGSQAFGFGVKTNPAAMASWQVDGGRIRLALDVRCGAEGVRLGERRLELARVYQRAGQPGENLYQFAHDFCQVLNPTLRIPAQPVYGSNDWYNTYGNSTAESILEDARITSELAGANTDRPFAVIDAGWSNLPGVVSCDTGIRDRGNERFGDMPGLAAQLKSIGVRPGIWVRPLVAPPETAENRLLHPNSNAIYAQLPILDPSIPENLEIVAADFRRLAGWGYELIKHDFSTAELLGRWGFEMGADLTYPGWSFADRTRTSAEIIRGLYETIRAAAGETLILGCNTIGHLGAGLFDINRTGDDTSGREWERTRKMGVNTLAFRMAQHETFFAADADCVGLTGDIPWELNRQWLSLLARSGTPLFVSADPAVLGPEQKQALCESFDLAATTRQPGQPMDWLDTICPASWMLSGERVYFNWYLS